MSQLTKICPSCRTENNPTFEVCWKCHADFTTGNQQPPLIVPTVEARSGIWDGVKLGCGMFVVLPALIGLLIGLGFIVLYAIGSSTKSQPTKQEVVKNQAVRSAIDVAIRLSNYKLEHVEANLMSSDGLLSPEVRFFPQFQNMVNQTIVGLKFTVKISDAFNDLALDEQYKYDGNIKGGKSNKMDEYYSFEDNEFLNSQPYDLLKGCVLAETCRVDVIVDQVVFESGQTLGAEDET